MGYGRAEIARGAIGALIGIATAAATARLAPGGPALLPFIVAPMGAVAVLLFAVPASPLAQPWPALGGNLISTAIGLLAHYIIGDVLLSAAVGVGTAIGVMMLLRCLHPPGGACALLAATATPAIHDQGAWFVLSPVAINVVALLVIAYLVHNLTGGSYPHRPAPAPASPLGITTPDVEQAMQRLASRLDVLPADVVAIVRDAENHALDRRLGSIPVSRIMNPDPVVAHPHESIYRARLLLVQRQVKTLPIIDEQRRVVGVVSIIDLFSRDLVELEPVGSIMRREVTTIPAETPVGELVPLMTSEGYKNLPVVDSEGHLVGMITRGELIAVLHRALLGQT